MTRAAIYLRVSTAAQANEDRYGLAVQENACRAYAKSNRLEVSAVFTDTITGTTATREGLSKLLESADQFETVIISSVDRLARRTMVAYAVLGQIQEAGLTVHSSANGLIDLDDDSSAIGFGVQTIFADADHRRTVKKLRAGMIAKVASGKPVMPLNCYGWDNGKIDEDEAKWLRWIFEWALRISGGKIAERLNQMGVPISSARGGYGRVTKNSKSAGWCETTIRNIVKNPTYKGVYTFGRDAQDIPLARCTVPALIEPDFWERVQRAVSNRRSGGPRIGKNSRAQEFPLIGFIRCGTCGSIFGFTASRQQNLYHYRCNKRVIRAGVPDKNRCTHKTHYPARALEGAVLEYLQKMLTDDRLLAAALEVPVPVLVDMTQDIAKLEQRIVRAKKLVLDEFFTPEEYREEKVKIEAQIATLRNQTPLPAPKADLAGARAALQTAIHAVNLRTTLEMVGFRAVMSETWQLEIFLDI